MKVFLKKIVLSALLLAAISVRARNVDLSTVPQRDSVELTIYNSADITLVREQREITFKKGINGLQFSWTDTLIDPTSVELKFLSRQDELELLDTTFPHDKPTQLVWNILSEFDGAVTVEISYFTSGISWNADYTLVSDENNEKLSVEGFVRIFNNSGEEYQNAKVRLIVGKINLVESISVLASKNLFRSEEDGRFRRLDGARKTDEKPSCVGVLSASIPMDMECKQEIGKESVSEYFIFSIPGRETIPNRWSKRIRAIVAQDVPFQVKYRYRPREYGNELVRIFTFRNDKKSNLGDSPMPDGQMRVFCDNGRGGLSYLASFHTAYVPAGDLAEVNLGSDKNVTMELIPLRAYRDEIWMQVDGVTVLNKYDGSSVAMVPNQRVVGFDSHVIYSQRVRNFSSRSVDVEIRRDYDGDVEVRADLPKQKSHDVRTFQFTVQANSGETVDSFFEVVRRHGRNSKNSNQVVLKREKIDPSLNF